MSKNEENLVTIETLPLNASTHLTEGFKKQLINIIESEFKSQTTLFDIQLRKIKNDFLAQYKKEVDFKKKLEAFNKANQRAIALKEELLKTGLTDSGEVQAYGPYGEKLLARMEEAAKSIQPATNNKNKIITRMLMCSTYGEAMVIMNYVLGNGILPSVTTAQLEQK